MDSHSCIRTPITRSTTSRRIDLDRLFALKCSPTKTPPKKGLDEFLGGGCTSNSLEKDHSISGTFIGN